MSISTALKSRLLWGVVLGFIAGGLFAPPQFVEAQTRTSLASLQAQVDSLQGSLTSMQTSNTALQGRVTTLESSAVSQTQLATQLANCVQLGAAAPQNGSVTVTGNLSAGGTISGNGSGLTNLDGSSLSTGQIPAARIPFSALDARYVLKAAP